MQTPIERYNGKNTENYKYYANDFAQHRERQWQSIYYQAYPIITKEDVNSVLEFGGGRDTTRALSHHMGVDHIDVDVSDKFFPDVNATIMDYDFKDKQYDLVCSFQCLEHNPFGDLDKLIPHMMQFSKKYFYISVPYKGNYMSLYLNIRLPKFTFSKQLSWIPNWFVNSAINEKKIRNQAKKQPEKFHDYHWWEVGMKGLSRKSFIKKMENYGLKSIQTFHNSLMPYHLFCLFEKK